MTPENSRLGGYTDHALLPGGRSPKLPKHRGQRKLRLLLLVGELLPAWVGVRESVISSPTGSERGGALGETGRGKGETYPLGDLLSTT